MTKGIVTKQCNLPLAESDTWLVLYERGGEIVQDLVAMKCPDEGKIRTKLGLPDDTVILVGRVPKPEIVETTVTVVSVRVRSTRVARRCDGCNTELPFAAPAHVTHCDRCG